MKNYFVWKKILKNIKNSKSFYKRYTMDTIWNAAFGEDIDIQNKTQENFYFTQCEKLLADFSNFGFVHYFASKPCWFSIWRA